LNPITALLASLGGLTAAYLVGWGMAISQARKVSASARTPATDVRVPTALQIGLGAVTNFFDALGVGSFATTTAVFRLRRMVPDRIIPGTLNAGHAVPTIAQAFIYTSLIEVDAVTLFSMIGASVIGAWLGAGVVARWSRRNVQIGMGLALLGAAALMLMTQLNLFPAGGATIGVRGVRLAIGIGGNFMLGALMTLGIGLYAPCMILVSLLGMNPKAAFPIMMGSCAFLMPVGSLRFIREKSYSLRDALGLTLGGVPGVLLAAYIVKELPLYAVRWLVVVVVVYTAIMMLMSAAREPAGRLVERNALAEQ
jgi:uncharacterized membrane protein YfcA